MKTFFASKLRILFVLTISSVTSVSTFLTPVAHSATVGTGNCVQTVDTASNVAVASSGIYCYVAFKSGDRVWNIPTGVTSIDYLVVGGGGSGGARHGGGGGAGGLVKASNVSLSNITQLYVSVGQGAAAVGPWTMGLTGSDSYLSKHNGLGSFTTALAKGGGAGEGNGGGARTGGSGGGAQTSTRSSGTSGQGNAGGLGATGNINGVQNWWSGGGGGAGGIGSDGWSNGVTGGGGAGGVGAIWISDFTTTIATALGLDQTNQVSNNQVYFAGGGGGSITNTYSAGSGGLGGGGNANVGQYSTAYSGTPNSGGGGGGSGCCDGVTSGAGGSGVVIIRYIWDVTAPTISSISITSSPGADSIYGAGETITLTLGWSETVTVAGSGIPRIPIQGLSSKYLSYASGTGGTSLTFTYVVVSGDVDRSGIAISANSLELNNGTIKDAAGNNATLSHNAISESLTYQVDGSLPVRTTIQTSADGSSITLTYNETLSATGPALNRFTIQVNGVANAVTGISIVGSSISVTLSFSVISGATVTLAYSDPTAGNDPSAIQDEAGNDAASITTTSVTNLSTALSNTSATIALNPVSTAAIYRTVTVIQVSTNTAGKVDFYQSGKIIPGCRRVATSGNVASCNWKPSVQTYVNLTARFVPNGAGFTTTNSAPLRIFVTKRTGNRS